MSQFKVKTQGTLSQINTNDKMGMYFQSFIDLSTKIIKEGNMFIIGRHVIEIDVWKRIVDNYQEFFKQACRSWLKCCGYSVCLIISPDFLTQKFCGLQQVSLFLPDTTEICGQSNYPLYPKIWMRNLSPNLLENSVSNKLRIKLPSCNNTFVILMSWVCVARFW